MTTSRREQLLQAAKRLQETKDQALGALVDAEEDVLAAESALADKREQRTSRLRNARNAGWSDTELRKIGISLDDEAKPARKQRAKKSPRQTVPAVVPAVPGEASSAGADENS